MLETRRLLLRRWRATDRAILPALLGDARVMEFSDTGPLTADAQAKWLRTASKDYDDALPWWFAIEHKRDRDVLGYISLLRAGARGEEGDTELGFRLLKKAWRQGFATEAAQAVLEAAALELSISRLIAIVDPHNRASVRVLEKIGLTPRGEVMLPGYAYADALYALDLGQ